jgi:hypothetical protein
MGYREQNFYNRLASRMGFEKEAGEIQDLYLDRKYAEAAAAVPLEFIDRTSLIGPIDRIAEKMQLLAKSGVTTINLSGFGGTQEERIATLRKAADALDKSGVGD